MSETMPLPPLAGAPEKRPPTVYFIDDSATMREVVKIAFRRENINIITCGDAAAALAQFDQNPPDAVITDVIMPDQDGYSVCTQIKQHAEYGSVPVILMSGVVNKTVADKAVAVKADELIRKPFQPQELIARVKALLGPKVATPPPPPTERRIGASSLQSLFAPPAPPPAAVPAPPPAYVAPQPIPPAPPQAAPPENVWPRALAEAFTPKPEAPAAPASFRAQAVATDIVKLKTEIARLELLIKKLQTELQIERQYNQALEQH